MMDPMNPELLDAIRKGDREAVAMLLNARPELLRDRNDQGVSAVSLAMYHGQPAIAQLFLERGAELDLHEACAVGALERVAQLTRPDNVNSTSADGFPPLGLACYFGHEDVARYLIAQGADVNLPAANAMKVCPIHAAAARRSEPIVRLLLENGADPNARQQGDYTALDAARQNGDTDIIDLLLRYGASQDSTAHG